MCVGIQLKAFQTICFFCNRVLKLNLATNYLLQLKQKFEDYFSDL